MFTFIKKQKKLLQHLAVIIFLIINISAFVFLFLKYETLRHENTSLNNQLDAAREFANNYLVIKKEFETSFGLQNKCIGTVTPELIDECNNTKSSLDKSISNFTEKINLNVELLKQFLLDN